jgi:hypothetical protein
MPETRVDPIDPDAALLAFLPKKSDDPDTDAKSVFEK